MKRLTLEAFKVKNLKENQQQPVDQLLGQVLGECHDNNHSGGGGDVVYDLDRTVEPT